MSIVLGPSWFFVLEIFQIILHNERRLYVQKSGGGNSFREIAQSCLGHELLHWYMYMYMNCGTIVYALWTNYVVEPDGEKKSEYIPELNLEM